VISKKILKPESGHGWTVIFVQPVLASEFDQLPKSAMVFDGTVEFFGPTAEQDALEFFNTYMGS